MMNRTRWITGAVLAAALLMVKAPAVHAQAVQPLGFFYTAVPTPSAYPVDWQSTQSLTFMQVFNPNNVPITGYFFAALLVGNTVVGQTDPKFHAFTQGPTILQTPQQVFWKTLKLTGKTREVFDRTGRLPDGTYTVQIFFFNGQTVTGIPVPPAQTSAQFTVSFPKPPSLLAPMDRGVVKIPTPVFQWQPIFDATGQQPDYLFRLVEILPGQTPLRAIEANRPLFETFVSATPTLTYPAEAPLLQPDHAYAWRVQAVTQSSVPVGTPSNGPTVLQTFGQNEGRSQVYTFTVSIPGRHAIDATSLPASAPGDAPGGGPGGAPGSGPGGAPKGDSRYGGAGPDDGHSPTEPQLGNFADRILHLLVSAWRPGDRGNVARVHLAWKEQPAPDASPSGGDAPPSPGDAAPPGGDATPDTPGPAGLGPMWARLHGNASFASEAYSHDGYGTPSRPDRSARVVTGLSLGLLQDQLRVPINALVSGDQVSFRQNINQVSLMPKFEWAGMMAGNFAPQYSDFTLADATLLGGGIDLTPGRWHLGFVDGRARKAITPSATELVQPQFARNVVAGHVGYGNPQANNVDFGVMQATDDKGSLSHPDSTLLVTPEGNTVYSLRGQGALPGQHLVARVETAFSRYNRDLRAAAGDVSGRAVGLDLARQTGATETAARVEYLNGGFMSLGNSGITGDRVGFTLSEKAQMDHGKLMVNAVTGWRNDAVSDVVASPTKRWNLTLNSSWQALQSFGADVQMAFYTTNTGGADSTGSMDNTTRLFSVAPRWTVPVGRLKNTLTGSVVVQSSNNSAHSLVPVYDTNSLALLANWTGAVSSYWSLNLSGNYTRTDFQVAVTEVSIFGPGITLNTRDSRLQGTLQLQVTRSRTGNSGVDTEAAPHLDMRWSFARNQALVLKGNYRKYQYANPGLAEFNERLASLEYTTTL